MPMQVNSSFKIKSIQLRKFDFDQVDGLENDSRLKLEHGIDARYKKDKNIYTVFVGTKLEMKQEEKPIYTVNSMILGHIEVGEGFDPQSLNNIVAILYSYLRPMVAQVTVMAKLPPLDLPPMNFTDLTVEKIKEPEELEDSKK